MGIRVYAWRVDLAALRALVGSGDAAQIAQLRARLEATPPDEGTLPGGPSRALQNWQLAGLGRPAPVEDVVGLVQGTPPEDGAAAVHALITLCGLLGASMTRYSFYSYRPHYAAIRDQLQALEVPPEAFDPERDVFFADARPPVPIPLPSDGLPGISTLEAEAVASVAPLLARRGLDPGRWLDALITLNAWGAGDDARQRCLSDFLALVDGILRRAPSFAENMAFEFDFLAEDISRYPDTGAELLGHTTRNLQAQLRELSEDALDVFEEIAHWFEEASAAQQGIVLLIF